MNQLTIIGVGPGDQQLVTGQAKTALAEAPILFGAKRHAHLVDRDIRPLEPLAHSIIEIDRALGHSDVSVMVSGDPTRFSLAKTLQKRLINVSSVRYIAGISSVEALFCALGEDASEAMIYSLHGRTIGAEQVIRHVQHTKTVVYLMDSIFNPSQICSLLVEYDMGNLGIAIGENLSYNFSRLAVGKARDFCDRHWESNCVMRIRNEEACRPPVAPTIRDDDWVRTKNIPMSKEEVRMISICKLEMSCDSILWDIGSGTGSIAVQSALLLPEGRVYAIDRNMESISLIKMNADRHHVPNVMPVAGNCPEALQTLPTPTHVFIGGSGGALHEILNEIGKRGSGIRIVINAVTLNTLQEANQILNGEKFTDYRLVQLQVNALNPRIGMLSAQNPVYIMSACTKQEKS